MDSPHVSIERAVAFLLHGGKLDPSEEEHLFKCDECKRLLVEAATTESKNPPDDSLGNPERLASVFGVTFKAFAGVCRMRATGFGEIAQSPVLLNRNDTDLPA